MHCHMLAFMYSTALIFILIMEAGYFYMNLTDSPAESLTYTFVASII